jgi:carbohydrate kinase (thermoresistant glucokinase family)
LVVSERSQILVVMGVSGAGKTSLGKALAEYLGWDFEEGDTLHPHNNIAKMSSGHYLDDADRDPWLDRVKRWIDRQLASGRGGVITCSALKRRYRDKLTDGRDTVVFAYLEADAGTSRRRLEARADHFMPPNLLDSQFADLEPPSCDENAITIVATDQVGDQVQVVVAAVAN